MRGSPHLRFARACAAGAVTLALIVVGEPVQARGETFTAHAGVKTPGGVSATAPVAIAIHRFSTDADRDALVTAIKQSGAAARDLLAARGDVGTLTVGARSTPIKFAYAQPTAVGRLITVVTAEPIVFLGAGVPGAKPKTGYDLGLVNIEVVAAGGGTGELVPATKIAFNDQGAIVTDDYSGTVVDLSDVVAQ